MRRWFSLLLCTTAGLVLASCASPVYNYQPNATQVSEPPLDVVSTAMVGDKMLEQGQIEELDVLVLNSSVTVGTLGTYTFSPGYYLKRGQSSEGEFFGPGGVANSGQVQPGPLTDPFQSILLEPDGSFCGVSVFGVKVCKSGVEVKQTKVPSATSASFQQTLIYNGRVGDKINIGYREFSGDLARPAFNNAVEYDLKESKTIGYKSAVIEVIDATNQSIKYVVRHNFNGATR